MKLISPSYDLARLRKSAEYCGADVMSVTVEALELR
jgi:hypothetical protein